MAAQAEAATAQRKTQQPAVEEKHLQSLAPATKAKIRNLMSVLFNHAIRWDFA